MLTQIVSQRNLHPLTVACDHTGLAARAQLTQFSLDSDACFIDEFSRISWSRGGALTLVIDPDDGSPISVAYCISARSSLADAISDLRHREGTSNKRIGWLDIGT